MGWEAGSDQRPVTVGTSKGKGVEVYCFVERSLLSCWCVHSGVESPLIGLVAYCRAGPETHSWRILSCPPSQEPPWSIRTLLSVVAPQWATPFP